VWVIRHYLELYLLKSVPASFLFHLIVTRGTVYLGQKWIFKRIVGPSTFRVYEGERSSLFLDAFTYIYPMIYKVFVRYKERYDMRPKDCTLLTNRLYMGLIQFNLIRSNSIEFILAHSTSFYSEAKESYWTLNAVADFQGDPSSLK